MLWKHEPPGEKGEPDQTNGGSNMESFFHKALVTVLVSGLIALIMILASETSVSAMERPPRIPMEDFFRKPDMTGFQISPSGTHYSFLKPWKNRLNVYVRKIGSEEEAIRITSSEARDIYSYGWLNDSRLVYFQDNGGDENTHAYAVDIDGSNFMDLTPFEGAKAMLEDVLEDDPDHILITMNKRDPRVFDVYRVNVNSGEMKIIAENPGNIAGWGTDHDGKLRLAITVDGLKETLLYRKTEQEEFQPLITTDFTDSVSPAVFTADNDRLYVLSNLGRDKLALYLYDPETKEFLDLIYENQETDVSGIIWSRERKKLLGATYYTDRLHRHFFDKETEDFFSMLQQQFPDYSVGISSMSRDETKMIAYMASDRMPGRLYYYDKTKPGEFTLLTDLYPWLREEWLAERKPVTYKTRDGLTIHGYLTLPVGVDQQHLPVVVNPHGGPEARDRWGYDAEAQFLANRGIAVFNMNYRVSTGYGKEFWMSGFRQWGQKQQDDITDGVKWLISEGIADPERIAIYGASYGGYATLMGLIKTPELYACGIDYVGVTDLFTLFESIPPYWEILKERMYHTIGHPEKDKEMFRKYSPVFHADKIKVPLFIAQGANDPRVVKKESDMMVEAMRKRGIEVQYMVKENEGHGFRNQENQFDFYRAMEEFLTEHLDLQ